MLDLLAAFLEKTAWLREDFKPGTMIDMLTPCIIDGAAPIDSTSSDVLLTIRTQLLQSGLLDSMTGVLTAAAEDLQSQQQGHNYMCYYNAGRHQQDDDKAFSTSCCRTAAPCCLLGGKCASPQRGHG